MTHASGIAGHADPAHFDSVDAVDPDYYVRFLDSRYEVAGELQVKELITAALELDAGLSVLDVGSGTGRDACAIARVVTPQGSVVGVDVSTRMVEEARKRAAALGVAADFVEGDGAALTFPDATFDRSRAERVLMHVQDPERVVREMVRVTRPGGLVVVSEIDAGTIFLGASDSDVVHLLEAQLNTAFPNGRVGRHLHRMLAASGLVDVRCVPVVVLNTVAFVRMVIGNRLTGLVEAGATTAAAAEAFWAEQERAERDGWLCTGVTCFTAVGRKP